MYMYKQFRQVRGIMLSSTSAEHTLVPRTYKKREGMQLTINPTCEQKATDHYVLYTKIY